jgi:hypothetical protein
MHRYSQLPVLDYISVLGTLLLLQQFNKVASLLYLKKESENTEPSMYLGLDLGIFHL